METVVVLATRRKAEVGFLGEETLAVIQINTRYSYAGCWPRRSRAQGRP